ncbi:cation-transporting P-type ATPase [Dactylosporangium sp. AC04546]|uniref:cation-translocating P-type ATPase n=1 Tax=Dactylosporangium sp. AC04546 TaxID=2862460 RepID=UPI001EDFCE9A|nr:cation-transporting P-type ATPase [Dactylosporangium sp. AC04546]WVK78530.1 cation-transporting P-type ATPase [Dactylosporangium sp. AC04546]
MTTTTSAPAGLTTARAAEIRSTAGRNELPAARPPSIAGRIAAQLRDPLIVVLLAAMVVTAVLRDLPDLAVIALVVVLNTTIGVVQEVRADRAVAALRRMAAPHARVRRDGADVVLPAAELVPGDVVRVEAGDVVPADLRVAEAVRLTADESALTGESMTVSRAAGDELSAGTVTATGRAVGVVVRTGTDSALGRIAALVAGQPRRATPLQRRLAGLGKVLAAVAVTLSAVVFAVGVLRGQPVTEMLLAAVSLTVAAVPESLPAVVTLALALGAHRMARRSAIVRRLPTVETLGSVTVLATDKTGTLTEGLMSVERFVLPDGADITFTGRGYDPRGTAEPAPGPDGLELARALVLCTDAGLATGDDGTWTPVGDPMEAALLTAAGRCGVGVALRDRYERVDEVPFDAERRRMTTVHADPAGGYLVVVKGAPDALLTGDELGAAQLADDGYRVLAVATAHHDELPAHDRLEDGLRLLGLVALTDPVREAAPATVAAFHAAGIRPILITGDHPATATAVAARVGLVRAGDDPAAAVYARTRPEEKLTIIRRLQRDGHVVAMTGDGVNDAPALRRADIGVAMGRGGTEAARQAADLVLADDDLATIGTAIREGRRIYANIRRFLVYALAGGVAEILVMLAGPWLGLAVPLLPAQILWINMITHGLPGVALGGEPATPDLMRRPPRRPDQAVLGGLTGRIALIGALITATVLGTALWTAHAGGPWQTVLFVTLGLAQLGVALALRVRAGRARNRSLDAAVALSLLLQVAAVWLPPLRDLLGTEPLTLVQLGACALAAAVPGAITALVARRPGTNGPAPAAREAVE